MTSSLLLPLIVVIALLILNLTNPYNTVEGRCFPEHVLYRIIFAVLFLTSSLIVTMGTVLCRRVYRSDVLTEYDKQHKKALCEMLPLLAYPILFFILTVPIFASTIINVGTAIFTVFAPMWSFTTSLLFIVHITVVGCIKRNKRKKILMPVSNSEGVATVYRTSDSLI